MSFAIELPLSRLGLRAKLTLPMRLENGGAMGRCTHVVLASAIIAAGRRIPKVVLSAAAAVLFSAHISSATPSTLHYNGLANPPASAAVSLASRGTGQNSDRKFQERAQELLWQLGYKAARNTTLGPSQIRRAITDFLQRHNSQIDINAISIKESLPYLEEIWQQQASPLLAAASKGNSDILSRIIEKKVLLNCRDEYGRTPLHLAAENNHIGIVRSLIDAQSSLEQQDKRGNTPLHLASREGHADVIMILLKAGANPNVKTYITELTPLHLAASALDYRGVKLLVDNNANIEARNYRSQRPIHYATMDGSDKKNILILLHAGADPNVQDFFGNTPLHYAAYHNLVTISSHLIHRGAHVNMVNNAKQTPLYIASGSGYFEMVQRLLSFNANTTLKSEYGLPLHAAVHFGHDAIVKLLLSVAKNVNDQDTNGNTALHISMNNCHLLAAKHLINKGAAIDAIGESGYTALHFAVDSNCRKGVKLLVDHQAKMSVETTEGATPLQLAYDLRRFKIAKLLKKAGGVGSLSTGLILRVQIRLKSLGFYSGQIDGKAGPNTLTAIRKFHKHIGLPPSSKITQAILDHSAIRVLKKSPQLKMNYYPKPGDFIAYSLKSAENIIRQYGIQNVPHRFVGFYEMGGINRLRGLVYDRERGDIILVGEHDPKHATLTIDDLAVALRSAFLISEFPLVSIEYDENTYKDKYQVIRFEGGIENTQFGFDLLDADFRLKELSFDLVGTGVENIDSPWDLKIRQLHDWEAPDSLVSRLWFYPIFPEVLIRNDVVDISNLRIGVYGHIDYAVKNGSAITDKNILEKYDEHEFVDAVYENFEEMAQAHSSFSRVEGLAKLVAISKGIAAIATPKDIAFWLEQYSVKFVQTPTTVDLVERKQFYKGTDGLHYDYRVQGGVHLMAIAARLRAGDVSVLKEAVLSSRPTVDALYWTFIVGKWIIPGALIEKASPEEQTEHLLRHAGFLIKHRHFGDAIKLIRGITAREPSQLNYYVRAARILIAAGAHETAVETLRKAELADGAKPWDFVHRGDAFIEAGDARSGIQDLTRAMERAPNWALPVFYRGMTYLIGDDFGAAKKDFDALVLRHPHLWHGYMAKAFLLLIEGRNSEAMKYIQNAYDADISTGVPIAYSEIARVGLFTNESSDISFNIQRMNFDWILNKVLVNSKSARLRGWISIKNNNCEEAVAHFNSAAADYPNDADNYAFRAYCYFIGSESDMALADFNKALSLRPEHTFSFYNRGILHFSEGRYNKALEDWQSVLSVLDNRAASSSFWNRIKSDIHARMGSAYEETAEYSESILHLSEAIRLAPDIPTYYVARGKIHQKVGNFGGNCSDLIRACKLGDCAALIESESTQVCRTQ